MRLHGCVRLRAGERCAGGQAGGRDGGGRLDGSGDGLRGVVLALGVRGDRGACGGGDGDCGSGRLDGCAAREQRLGDADEGAEVESVHCPANALSLVGDRLGLLEPLRERAPGAEDQRLDGRLGDLELLGDLAVGKPLPLAQEDGPALLLGHPGERVLDPDQLVPLAVRTGDDFLDHAEVARTLDPSSPPRRAAARQADVLGDLEEPRALGLRRDALPERTERVHERRLDGVLSLLAGAELMQAVAVDPRCVALVERVRRGGLGRHRAGLDEVRATYGRYSGQADLLRRR